MQIFAATILLLLTQTSFADSSVTRLEVWPESIELSSKRARVQIVVTGLSEAGDAVDLTRSADFQIGDKTIAIVENGIASPRKNGETTVTVNAAGLRASIPIRVSNHEDDDPIRFRYETLAVLTKQGCNAGSCHGSPKGKGGFSLSLFAYSPEIDEEALIRDGLGRRTNPQDPDSSLMIRKPMLRIPHVGGKKLRKSDEAYRILHQWILEGVRGNSQNEPDCVRVEVYPKSSRVLDLSRKGEATQQLSVLAHFGDGSVRDVTRIATYGTSHDKVATVGASGLVTAHEAGLSAVTIRYLERLESVYFTAIRPVDGFVWTEQPETSFVDTHVNSKLRQMSILPSAVCSDEVFVRRVSLDLTGLLPTVEATRAFLQDDSKTKRAELVDRLLNSEEHPRFWAQKQADLMRVNSQLLPDGRADLLGSWIIDSFRKNQPFDEFARQVVTASGNTKQNAPANYFFAIESTNDVTETTSQVFMGSRINCAKCHNHPFENWTQEDYYSIGAVFARVKKDGDLIGIAESGEMSHPTSGKVMRPWGLPKNVDPSSLKEDRRIAFASWLTSNDNPFFARVEVNRIWSHLFGKGIVNPVDDFRSSNPPSNVELLDALSDEFLRSGFDRRHIIRTICNSITYQRSTEPNSTNENDELLFSRVWPQLLSAEQILDAVGQVASTQQPVAVIAQAEAETNAELGKLLARIESDQPRWEEALQEEVNRLSIWQDSWYSIGPFPTKSYNEAVVKTFFNEPAVDLSAASGKLKWQQQPYWNDGKKHLLNKAVGATLLVRSLIAREETTATVSLGTDDGVRVWLNGKQIHDFSEARGVQPGEDRIEVSLRKGRNELLLRVANAGGECAFQYELLDANDKPIAVPNSPPEILQIASRPAGERSAEDRARLLTWKQESSKLVQLLRAKLKTLQSREGYATQRTVPQQTDFLKAFGQPKRESPCACERSSEPTLDQALQMLNGSTVLDRVNRSQIRFEPLSDQKLVEELYLAALCRAPRDGELKTATDYLKGRDRQQAIRDLVWAVVNTQEFLLQH